MVCKWMFLILFCDIFKVKSGLVSHKTEKYLVKDKLSPLFQHGFLRSVENFYLHNLNVSVGENVYHVSVISPAITLKL